MALPVYTIESTVAITSSSVANPSVLLTAHNHGILDGQTIVISGHTGSTPDINGSHVATVIDDDQVSIPVNVTVGGTDGTLQVERHYQGGSIHCAQPWKGIDTLSFEHVSQDGSFRFQQWQKAYLKKDGTVIFGGLISRVEEQAWSDRGVSTGGIRCQITAQGFKTMAGWTTFTGSFSEQSLEARATAIATELASYGITIDTGMATGPTVPARDHDNESIFSILDKLTDETTWYWKIDPTTLKLSFTEPGTATCSDLSTASNLALGDVRVSRRRESWYANRVIVKVGQAGQDPPQSGETYLGDNSKRTFLLKHALNFYGPLTIRITYDGVPTDFVLNYPTDLYPTGTNEWSYDPDRFALVQDSGEPVLDADDTLTFPYNYGTIYPASIMEEDTAEQTAAGFIKTHVILLPETIELEPARELAASELEKRKATLTTVRYLLNNSDAEPGDVHTLTIAERSVSGTFTVNEIITRHVTPFIVRQEIVAVSGEFNTPTYREWYKKLAAVSGSGGVSSQGSQTTPISPGADQEVIYNDGGVLAGAPEFRWNKTRLQAKLINDFVWPNLVLEGDDGSRSSFAQWDDETTDIWLGAEWDDDAQDVIARGTTAVLLYRQDDATYGCFFKIKTYSNLTPGSAINLAAYDIDVYIGNGDIGGAAKPGIMGLNKAGATGAHPGTVFYVNRNPSGNGAAGCVQFVTKSGSSYFTWVDDSGKFRIGTAPPEEDGTPSDTSGTVVGTQT